MVTSILSWISRGISEVTSNCDFSMSSHEEYLKYEFRLALTDILNARIRYGKETCSVTVAMDKYVKGFLKCISDKDTSKFYCPMVSSVEWS